MDHKLELNLKCSFVILNQALDHLYLRKNLAINKKLSQTKKHKNKFQN